MACDLMNAYKNSTSCKFVMAGTGTRAYFFDKDAWAAAIDAEGSITSKGLPRPGYKGYYGLAADGTVDDTAIAKLELLDGLLYGVDIKKDSGQVTSEKGADTKASSQKAAFVVTDNIEAWNELAHSLTFKDWGCILPRVGGGFFMVMSPDKEATIENGYDSGTTYDSDYGFTVSIDASPAEYGVTFLPDGSKNLADGTTAMANTTITKSATGGASLSIA